ncbi:hypothetical protein MBANPS3_010938 [Mucor bainieri]
MQSISSGAYLKTSAKDGGEVTLKLSQPAILYVQMNRNRHLVKKETSDQGSFFQIHIEHVDVNTTLTIVSDLNSTICLQEIEMASHQQADSTQTYKQPQQQQPLIEFVGHDLTLGLGTSHLLMTSFPWIVSDMLDTERSQIASPKAWLMDHQELLGMETLYFKGDSFYAPPHIITILLGEYDDHHHPAAGPMYTRRLFMFVSNIRYRFPHAFIIVLSEPLGVLFQESQKAVYLMSDGDENIAFVDTTGWIRYGPTHYTNPLHLNDKGQELFAHKLAPLLKAKLNGLPFPVQPNPNLPYDWQTMDIGQETTTGLEGSVSFNSAHVFTLWGSGHRGAFRFVYQQLYENGTIEAVVESHATFAPCASAGIMLREHLGHTSCHVMLGFSPQHGVFISRNGHVVRAKKLSPPYRLRLQRQGGTIVASIASYSTKSDSVMWEPFYDQDIEMAPLIYLGLAVTSCDPAVVSVAKFSHVKLQGGVGRDGSYHSDNGRLLLQN